MDDKRIIRLQQTVDMQHQHNTKKMRLHGERIKALEADLKAILLRLAEVENAPGPTTRRKSR